ncbi:LamG domain-containing protein [Myxococcota bacterium]
MTPLKRLMPTAVGSVVTALMLGSCQVVAGIGDRTLADASGPGDEATLSCSTVPNLDSTNASSPEEALAATVADRKPGTLQRESARPATVVGGTGDDIKTGVATQDTLRDAAFSGSVGRSDGGLGTITESPLEASTSGKSSPGADGVGMAGAASAGASTSGDGLGGTRPNSLGPGGYGAGAAGESSTDTSSQGGANTGAGPGGASPGGYGTEAADESFTDTSSLGGVSTGVGSGGMSPGGYSTEAANESFTDTSSLGGVSAGVGSGGMSPGGYSTEAADESFTDTSSLGGASSGIGSGRIGLGGVGRGVTSLGELGLGGWGGLDVEPATLTRGSADSPGDAGCELCAARAALLHRYAFDGVGTTVTDSVGQAHGTVLNTQLAGSGTLVLAGSESNEYVDLPDGILSRLTDATLEVWVIWRGGEEWQRVLDFGDSIESASDPGKRVGRTSLRIIASAPGRLRVDYDGSESPAVSANAQKALPQSALSQIVVVVDSERQTLSVYLDGSLEGQAALNGLLSQVNDIDNWLGRSQFTNDPEFAGTYEEFRIYGAALSQAEIQASYAAGPDADWITE